MQHLLKLGAVVALTGALCSVHADAQTPLSTERIADGLSSPLWAGTTGVPGDSRLFVLEQNSADVEIFKNGVKNNVPYLDLNSVSGVTVTTGGERGLLGIAFHPDYDENGYVFVNYTSTGGATQIDRFTAQNPTADRVVPGSRVPVLNFSQPFTNHNGGWIDFGPDGYLYIGTGDGGSANDPQCRAQNPTSLLGKMLRIDIDTLDSTGAYSIPADNPFLSDPASRPEILHTGLRNPWRCSFDPLTGELYMGDVGQGLREEVSIAPLGALGLNYGWRILEGELCNGFGSCPGSLPGCASGIYTPPVQTYSLGGGNCSITGGVVYRGCAIPDLQGTYFYADYCSNRIWSFELVNGVATNVQVRTGELDPAGPLGLQQITSFGRDENGEVLIVDQPGGEVFRIIPQGVPAAGCDPLRADWNAVSIQSGGVQELALDAGSSNGSAFFAVLGSASGTTPGTSFGGATIPLNLDAYLSFTLANANQPPFTNSFGVLDANGRSETEIAIPAGVLSGAQAGLTLHHAAVVFDLGINPLLVSNAESLTLAP